MNRLSTHEINFPIVVSANRTPNRSVAIFFFYLLKLSKNSETSKSQRNKKLRVFIFILHWVKISKNAQRQKRTDFINIFYTGLISQIPR
jgi:hypothetical protein